MFFVIGILVGIILPMQTAINSKLQLELKSLYLTAMVAFVVAAIFLGLMTCLEGQSLGVKTALFSTQPWWIWLGGGLGIIGGTIPIFLFPRLGSVQTVVTPIFGQVIMSMLIDNFGWFASPIFKFNGLRLIGVLALLSGLLLVIVKKSKFNSAGYRQLFWQFLGLVAGAALASQAAVNGRLGAVLRSPIHAAFISFFMGTLILGAGAIFLKQRFSRLKNGFGTGKPWWIWTGGLLGGSYVFGNSFLAPLIGTGATVVIVLLGNILGGLLIDQWGWFEATRRAITFQKMIGLVLMLAGVALIKIF